jgi:hypothetical protein
VNAEKAPLAQVLKEIADRAGVEVQGVERIQAEISVNFFRFPLRTGLEKVLANANYLFLEGSTTPGATRPALVVVFGKRDSASEQEIVVAEGMKSQKEMEMDNVADGLQALQAAALEGNTEALRKALSDPNPTVQATALDLLVEKDGQGTVPLLVEATKSKQAEVRFRALELLNNSQADAGTVTAALGQAISGEDRASKSYALRALAERGGAEATGYLRQALQDPDPSIRMGAIDTIVRSVPPEQRLPLLQEAAQDQDTTVRSAASAWLEDGVPER